MYRAGEYFEDAFDMAYIRKLYIHLTKKDDVNSWVALQHLFKSQNGVTAACSVLIYIISNYSMYLYYNSNDFLSTIFPCSIIFNVFVQLLLQPKIKYL